METAIARVRVGGFAGWALEVLQGIKRRAGDRRQEHTMDVVETLSLGGKRKLALVDVDGQRFLVGMSEGVDAIAAMPVVDTLSAQNTLWKAGL